MTQPETCGAAGGAVTLWVKVNVNALPNFSGIMSSYEGDTATGLYMDTRLGKLR